MSTQLAAKLQPLLAYLVMGNAVLLCLALLLGGYLILRRFLSKDPAKGSALDNEQIAWEISAEIKRLYDLRAKILPGSEGPSLEMKVGTAPLVAAGNEPAVGGKPVDPAAHERFQQEIDVLRRSMTEQQTTYNGKITELEIELAAARAGSGGTRTEAPAPAPMADPAMVEAEVAKIKAILEKEKEEINGKVTHLEKVLSEYRIFEEDFALVKKYKTENERLKKQMSAGGQVSEDEINKLFASVDAPAPAKSDAPKVDADNFFNEMFGAKSSESADSAEMFRISPAPEPTSGMGLGGGGTVSQDEIDALLGLGGGSSSAATPPTAAAASAAPPQTQEELEALAESSVNDDKLIAEFEKILGEKGST